MIIADGVNGDASDEMVLSWMDIAISRELAQSTVANPKPG